jgi:hypothetical protein
MTRRRTQKCRNIFDSNAPMTFGDADLMSALMPFEMQFIVLEEKMRDIPDTAHTNFALGQ